MTQHIAKVFMNGRSQAIRLPKEFRFDSDEVYLRKIGNEVVISSSKPTWDTFFNQKTAFGADFFPQREDTPPQERDFF
jgi:antitoxin VapB